VTLAEWFRRLRHTNLIMKLYKCYGGPHDGQYKPYELDDDYIQFNSSVGELYPDVKVLTANNKAICIGHKATKRKKMKVDPYCPKSILVYCPYDGAVIIDQRKS